MVIDKKSQSETHLPRGEKSEQKMQNWTHQRCGTVLAAPVEGAKNVTCTGCGITVTIPSLGNQIQNRKPSRRRKTEHIPWGNRHEPKKNPSMLQYDLEGNIVEKESVASLGSKMNILDSQRIHGRNKLTKYIPSGKLFRSVGYDWNCHMILEIVKENQYEKSIIIIGYNMSGSNDNESTILELHDLITEGKLEIRTIKPKGPWHEKFFFIEGIDTETQVPFWIDVNGSSNPTFHGTGKKGGQSNRITRIGFEGNYSVQEYVKEAEEEWNWYMENSNPFEGELFELLNNVQREERVKTITRFYSGEITNDEDSERTPVEILRAHVGGELLRSSSSGQKVIKMELGDYSIDTVNTFVSEMVDLGYNTRASVDGTIELPVSILDSTKYTTDSVPYMKLDQGSVIMRAQGDTVVRTNRDYDPIKIDLELAKIEAYVQSIENSTLPGLKSKMALSEYLLSGLCSPFDYLWMEMRKKKYKRVTEGPRMTSYFGGSGNGKSYASRYLLKMITGLDLEPLSSEEFTEMKVRGVAKNGSCMPLVFDDLKKNRIREWDAWGKFFWDRGHVVGHPHSQLLVTANDRISTQGNLGRRVREIWMEATFVNNGKNTEVVENCLVNCSDIFPYFSGILLDMYFEEKAPYDHNDPLKIGRVVFDKLYDLCERKKPEWWCPLPYNDCVDANAYHWFDILNKGLFEIERKFDSFSIDIDETPHEINDRLKTFNAHLQAKKAGRSINIGNADGMIEWLKKVSHLYSSEKGKPTRRMRKLLRKGY
jgi:hypothetical protein